MGENTLAARVLCVLACAELCIAWVLHLRQVMSPNTLVPAEASRGTLQPNSLKFTANNWKTPQAVKFAGACVLRLDLWWCCTASLVMLGSAPTFPASPRSFACSVPFLQHQQHAASGAGPGCVCRQEVHCLPGGGMPCCWHVMVRLTASRAKSSLLWVLPCAATTQLSSTMHCASTRFATSL